MGAGACRIICQTDEILMAAALARSGFENEPLPEYRDGLITGCNYGIYQPAWRDCRWINRWRTDEKRARSQYYPHQTADVEATTSEVASGGDAHLFTTGLQHYQQSVVRRCGNCRHGNSTGRDE